MSSSYNFSTSFTYKDVINRDRSSRDNNWTMEFPWSKSIFCAFCAQDLGKIPVLLPSVTSSPHKVALFSYQGPCTHSFQTQWNEICAGRPILCCDCRQCRWGLIRPATQNLKVWWPFHSAWCLVWLRVRVKDLRPHKALNALWKQGFWRLLTGWGIPEYHSVWERHCHVPCSQDKLFSLATSLKEEKQQKKLFAGSFLTPTHSFCFHG